MNQPNMLEGERTDAYMRRTGHKPPHWTADQDLAWDAKCRMYEEVAGSGITARDRAKGRRWLRRHGID